MSDERDCRRDGYPCAMVLPRDRWCDLCDERDRREHAVEIAEAWDEAEELELKRRAAADNGNRTDLDDAIVAFGFSRDELEAELDAEEISAASDEAHAEEARRGLSLKEMLAKRPADQDAVEAHKARMRAEIEAHRGVPGEDQR